jgi:hypothetical protein
MRNGIEVVILVLMCSVAWGQTANTQSTGAQPGNSQSMPGMNMPGMSGHDMSNMQVKDMPVPAEKDGGKDAESDASTHVMNSMEGHMDMGPHMKMTSLRQLKPGDAARAQQVAEEARKASEKYTDYHSALADGYKIFHPELPQKMYHFTNYGYAMEAAFHFNPEHPTSLLYEKHGDDYKLIGVMYTAPKRFTEDQLDERIPLSVAQWHEHVNFCAPPSDRRKEVLAPHAEFGLRGSITTQEACDAAGGTFHPVIFNWMVHVYPFEKDQAKVWSVERQHGDAD